MIKNLFTVRRVARLAVLSATALGFTACNNSGNSSTSGGGITSAGANTLTMMSPRVSTSNLYPAHGFFIIANNTDTPVLDVKYSVTNPSGDGAKSVLNTDSANACATVAAHNECILYVDTPNTSGIGSYELTATNSKGTQTSNPVYIQNGVFNSISGSDGVSLSYNTSVVAGQQYVVVTGLVASPNTGKFNNAVLLDNAGNALPNQQSISGNLGNNLQYLRTGDTFAIAMPVPAGVGSTQNFKLQLNTLDENGNVSDIINGVSTYAVTTVATTSEAQAVNSKILLSNSQTNKTVLKMTQMVQSPSSNYLAGLDISSFVVTTLNPTISHILTLTNNSSSAASVVLQTRDDLPISTKFSFTGLAANGYPACTLNNIPPLNIKETNISSGATCTVSVTFSLSTETPVTDYSLDLTWDGSYVSDLPITYGVVKAVEDNKLSLSFDQGNGKFAANGNIFNGTTVSHVLNIKNLNTKNQSYYIDANVLPSGFRFISLTPAVNSCPVDTNGNVVGSLMPSDKAGSSCSVLLSYEYNGQPLINKALPVADTTASNNSSTIDVSTTYTPGIIPILMSLNSPNNPGFQASTDGSITAAKRTLLLVNFNYDKHIVSLDLPSGFSFDKIATDKLTAPCKIGDSGSSISNLQLSGPGTCGAVVEYNGKEATNGMVTTSFNLSDYTNPIAGKPTLSVTYQVNQSTANLSLEFDEKANVDNIKKISRGLSNNLNDSATLVYTIKNTTRTSASILSLNPGNDKIPSTLTISGGSGCTDKNIEGGATCTLILKIAPTKATVVGTYKFNPSISYLPYPKGQLIPLYIRDKLEKSASLLDVKVFTVPGAVFSTPVLTTEGIVSANSTQNYNASMVLEVGKPGILTYTYTNSGTADAEDFYIGGVGQLQPDTTKSSCPTTIRNRITLTKGEACKLVYTLNPITQGLLSFNLGNLKYNWKDKLNPNGTSADIIGPGAFMVIAKPHNTYFVGAYPSNCTPGGMLRPSDTTVCTTIKYPSGSGVNDIWYSHEQRATDAWKVDHGFLPLQQFNATSPAGSNKWQLPDVEIKYPTTRAINAVSPGGEISRLGNAALNNGYVSGGNLLIWMNNNGFNINPRIRYFWTSFTNLGDYLMIVDVNEGKIQYTQNPADGNDGILLFHP